MLEYLNQPWPWYVVGPLIALVMLILKYYNKSFGFSSNLGTICTMAGAGRAADFFKTDWKTKKWNLVFLVGAVIGGFIASQFLSGGGEVIINPLTIGKLNELGFQNVGAGMLPQEIFGLEKLDSLSGLLILLGGGFLVGFGTRYAGGCTSGHAISGLSELQLPSLIAVVGFFIGGLVMTHFLLPIIFS
jgi:uncharacterized membrane protein YedE/YeeE